MSEIIKEFKKGDLLYIDNDGKAEWGYPEGYPYKEGSKTIIEWDGNTEGLKTVTVRKDNVMLLYYKISDIVPTRKELLEGSFCMTNGIQQIDITITESLFSDYVNEAFFIKNTNDDMGNSTIMVNAVTSDGFDAGVYFLVINGFYVKNLSYGSETIHPMAPQSLPYATTTTPGAVKQMPYLPNATGDAPTAENFNQLVRQLKNAGLMK